MRGAVAPGCLELEHRSSGGVGLQALVGQCRAADVAARVLQLFAVMCFDPHCSLQAEPVDVDARGLARCSLAWHRDTQGEPLLHGARPESEAVSDGRGLQRTQRDWLLPVCIRLGQVGLARVLDQPAPAREHLRELGVPSASQWSTPSSTRQCG